MTARENRRPITEGSDVILTPAEVAVWLRLKPRQLERLGVPRKKLGIKTIRYIKADVLAWLAAQKGE